MNVRPKTCLLDITALVLTCLSLAMNAKADSERLLFDFRTATNSPAWQVVNDDVMGGVSTSQFQILTNGGVVFSGVVSLENNGGFASMRSSPVRTNLNGFDAFALRVRGDGQSYKFIVRADAGFDAPMYQASFITKRGEWEEHRLPFKDFVPTYHGRVLSDVPPLDPTRILSLGVLISDKQAGSFRLELSWIKAVTR